LAVRTGGRCALGVSCELFSEYQLPWRPSATPTYYRVVGSITCPLCTWNILPFGVHLGMKLECLRIINSTKEPVNRERDNAVDERACHTLCGRSCCAAW
jgi:hypothetical protein